MRSKSLRIAMVLVVAIFVLTVNGLFADGIANTVKDTGAKSDNLQENSQTKFFNILFSAAEDGDAESQNLLGLLLSSGDGMPQDYMQAFKWFTKAAEQGLAEAQYHLGLCYANGRGVEQDYTEAVKWYTKAAEQGLADAQYNLGLCYTDGQGVEGDYTKAIKWHTKAAEQGLADAQYFLGRTYEDGCGVEQDHEEAIKWYSKAAEQRHMQAQFFLGFCYYSGKGVKQDYVEAIKWCTKAAEQGMAEAQFFLGGCYSGILGNVVEQDYEQSIKWYTKAAEQGHENSKEYLIDVQARLGNCYYVGEGKEKDYKEAVKWYRMAAEQGSPKAQGNLGICYYFGQGVVEDYVEAYKWFLLAGMNGEDISKFKIWLQEKLSPSGIEEAQKRATEFVEKKTPVVEQANSEPKVKSSGTGFFIDPDGYLVTACHVVEETKSIIVITNNGRFDAKVIFEDNTIDFAILKVEGNNFSSLNITPSSEVKAGDKVFTVGFPNIDIQGTEAKYTEGSISSLSGINNDLRHFQISVPVQPGNSGGPLLDSNGDVIGIIVSKLSDTQILLNKGTIPQNVNYAVKSSFVLPYIESVHKIEIGDKVSKTIDNQTAIQKSKNATGLILCY